MQERAMRLQEVPFAGGAVELTPRATAGMAIGPQNAPSQPASVITLGMGAKVHRGVDSTGTSVGRGHRSGWYRRQRQGMQSLLLTGRTVGFVRQAYKRSRTSWLRIILPVRESSTMPLLHHRV